MTAAKDKPTAPRPTDAAGRMLDQWGLPLGGPARVAALDGRPDPAVDPDGFAEPAPKKKDA